MAAEMVKYISEIKECTCDPAEVWDRIGGVLVLAFQYNTSLT